MIQSVVYDNREKEENKTFLNLKLRKALSYFGASFIVNKTPEILANVQLYLGIHKNLKIVYGLCQASWLLIAATGAWHLIDDCTSLFTEKNKPQTQNHYYKAAVLYFLFALSISSCYIGGSDDPNAKFRLDPVVMAGSLLGSILMAILALTAGFISSLRNSSQKKTSEVLNEATTNDKKNSYSFLNNIGGISNNNDVNNSYIHSN